MTKTGKPTAAGILTIVAGGMGIGICALKRRCWGMARRSHLRSTYDTYRYHPGGY